MAHTRITRTQAPDPHTDTIHIYSTTGEFIGTMTIEKGISRLDYAPHQQPHQPYPLKKKHRQR